MSADIIQLPRSANPTPQGDFGLIAADPPWRYTPWAAVGDMNNTRAPERHYQTQVLDWIANLPIAKRGGSDCHLMLWITGPLLVTGAHLPIMESWGFRPSSIAYVWIKQNKKALQGRFFRAVSEADFFMGLGKTTRQNAEFVVLGRRGRPVRHDKGNHQLIIEPRREHSRASVYLSSDDNAGKPFRRPTQAYRVWWDKQVSDRSYTWRNNPWVIVLEFTVKLTNIDTRKEKAA